MPPAKTMIFVFQRPAVRHFAASPGRIHGGPLKNKNFSGGIAFYTQVTPNGVTKTPSFLNLFKNKPLITPDSKPLQPSQIFFPQMDSELKEISVEKPRPR